MGLQEPSLSESEPGHLQPALGQLQQMPSQPQVQGGRAHGATMDLQVDAHPCTQVQPQQGV